MALARALATSPDLLLLDEPLTALDAGLRGVVLEHLKRCWQELGTPMVYVSHSISEVMALAETALVLSKGRKVVQGKISEVLVHPDVSKIAGYEALENLVETRVISSGDRDGVAELQVGHVVLLAPQILRPPGSDVIISIRAGDIILALEVPPRMSARNVVEAVVEEDSRGWLAGTCVRRCGEAPGGGDHPHGAEGAGLEAGAGRLSDTEGHQHNGVGCGGSALVSSGQGSPGLISGQSPTCGTHLPEAARFA